MFKPKITLYLCLRLCGVGQTYRPPKTYIFNPVSCFSPCIFSLFSYQIKNLQNNHVMYTLVWTTAKTWCQISDLSPAADNRDTTIPWRRRQRKRASGEISSSVMVSFSTALRMRPSRNKNVDLDILKVSLNRGCLPFIKKFRKFWLGIFGRYWERYV